MAKRPHTRKPRTERPSPAQQAVLLRHLTQLLGTNIFRQHLHALRASCAMWRDNRLGWVVPRERLADFERARRAFARRYFRGLGGEMVSGWLIIDPADWESKPLRDVVATLLELALCHLRHSTTEWRQAARGHFSADSTDYYAGETPFHPTVIWNETNLAKDLQEHDWSAQPSDAHMPWRATARHFVEVFPWTEEEDVRRAHAQIQTWMLRPLPRQLRPRRELSRSLELYRRYCSGDPIESVLEDSAFGDAHDLRRHLKAVARSVELPAPRRPRAVQLRGIASAESFGKVTITATRRGTSNSGGDQR
jgi:hypothetical protein